MNFDYPTPFQRKTLWNAITGVAILTLLCLVVLIIVTTGKVLGYLQPVLIPVAIAGVVAYLLDPIVTWFQKKRGFSRLRSVIAVFAAFTIVLSVLALIIVPPIISQVSNASNNRHTIAKDAVKTLNSLGKIEITTSPSSTPQTTIGTETAEATVETTSTPDAPSHNTQTEATAPQTEFTETNLGKFISDNAGKISAFVTRTIEEGTSRFLGILGLTLGFAMVPIYLYYFLAESASIKDNWHNYVPLKASKFKTEVVDCLQEINGYLISFFRGQMLVAMIDGLLVGIALWMFQLPYGLLIGIIMGVIGIIPFIGNIICLVPACIIAYVHFSANPTYLGENPWAYVGAVVVIFVVVQQINSLVTAPKIVGDSVGLHPMTVIFSMLFWSLILGGFIGTLLAVPLTAAVKVLFRRYIWERKIMDQTNEIIDAEIV